MDTLAAAVLTAVESLEGFRSSIIAITVNTYTPIEVHVKDTDFCHNFNNYKFNFRDSDRYPIELYEMIGGIKFFAIYSVEDFHATK